MVSAPLFIVGDYIFHFSNQIGVECWKDSCSKKAEYYCNSRYHCDRCCSCFNWKGLDNVKKQTGVHPIKYSHIHQASLPLCLEHDSFKTCICVTCQHICCRYCQHYHHNGHYTLYLDKYNEIKFRENISTNLEKVTRYKMQVVEAIKFLEKEEQSFSEKRNIFFKMLVSRKNLLIAKFLYMLEDIERKVLGNYFVKADLSKKDINGKKDRFNEQLDNVNKMVKRMEQFESKSHLEKYYDFKDLMEDFKSFDGATEGITENFTINLNDTDEHCDDQLYKSMSTLFVIDMKTEDFVEAASELYLYKPSMDFEATLKNDELIKRYIQDRLNSEFALKDTGKYLT